MEQGGDSWRHFGIARSRIPVWALPRAPMGISGSPWIRRGARYREGKFEVRRDQGLPRSRILCVYADRAGRLWFHALSFR
jgi:hypothetical protein